MHCFWPFSKMHKVRWFHFAFNYLLYRHIRRILLKKMRLLCFSQAQWKAQAIACLIALPLLCFNATLIRLGSSKKNLEILKALQLKKVWSKKNLKKSYAYLRIYPLVWSHSFLHISTFCTSFCTICQNFPKKRRPLPSPKRGLFAEPSPMVYMLYGSTPPLPPLWPRDVTSVHWREEKTGRMRFWLRVFAIIAFFYWNK